MSSSISSEFVEHWSRLWACPSEQQCRPLVTDDVVAYWSGLPEPIRGGDAYARHVGELAKLLPSLRLEITAYAEADDIVFISWRARVVAAGQLVEHQGIDRFRLRGGKTCESLIAYDPGPFAQALAADHPEDADDPTDPAKAHGGSRR